MVEIKMNGSISCIVFACLFLVGWFVCLLFNFHFVSNPVGRRPPVPVVSLIVVMKKSCPFSVCTCTCYVVVVLLKKLPKNFFGTSLRWFLVPDLVVGGKKTMCVMYA